MPSHESAAPAEIPLGGGRANVGSVVRVGDEVARPAHPQSRFVDHFLAHLRDRGMTLVPEPRGRDDQGRQRLSWIPGSAPTAPYPEWAFDQGLLVDVATRQRELHIAAADYSPLPDSVWAVSGGDYFPTASTGGRFCHNDLCLSNVIVDVEARRVAGFIDFDYVAPVDPLFDIAVLARHWAPFGDPDGREVPDVDPVARFATICQIHELDTPARGTVVDLAVSFLEQARGNVGALAAAGNPGFAAMIAEGYEATNLATQAWLTDHRRALVAP